MKKLLLILLFTFIANHSQAQDKLGIGGIIGDPDGFSMRAKITDDISINGAASFRLADEFSSFYLHADFIWVESDEQFDLETGALKPYYGTGIRLILRDDLDNTFGLRVPLGLRYELEDQNFDIFTEIAPFIDVEPAVVVSFSGGLGFRYYFIK